MSPSRSASLRRPSPAAPPPPSAPLPAAASPPPSQPASPPLSPPASQPTSPTSPPASQPTSRSLAAGSPSTSPATSPAAAPSRAATAAASLAPFGPTAAAAAAAAGAATRSPWSQPAPWLVLVLFATFLAYAPTLHHDFTWDDRFAAMGDNGEHSHPLVRELRPLADYFTHHYWPHVTEVSHTYRPLVTLTFALRYAACGDSPLPAHLFNVLAHVAATWLAYLLLRALRVGWRAALPGALVFGLHAIHSEAVAGVVGRADVLAFALGAAGFLALLGARQRPRLAALLWPAAALLLFCAFCSKESALAWVAFLPLCFHVRRLTGCGAAPLWPGMAPRQLAEAAVVAAPALLYLWLRMQMLASLPGSVDPAVDYVSNPLVDATVTSRWLTGIMVWGYALLLTALPFELAMDYGPGQLPLIRGFGDPAAWWSALAGAALLGVLAGGLRCHRRQPLLFLATACFFGFSFIVSNLPFPCFMVLGERTYYSPSFGLSLAVAWLAAQLPRWPRWRWPAAAALAAWTAWSLCALVDHNQIWRDNTTLLQRELRDHPRSVKLLLQAAHESLLIRDEESAAHYAERAVAVDPGNVSGWLMLASLYRARRDLDASERALRAAERGREAERTRRRAHLHAAWARLYLARGDDARARAAIDRCQRADPEYFARQDDLLASRERRPAATPQVR
jgi:hypothetical protein